MAIVKCHECGSEVSTEAAACPKCGAKPKIKLSVIHWIGIFVALWILYLFATATDNQKVNNDGAGSVASEATVITTQKEKNSTSLLEADKAAMSNNLKILASTVEANAKNDRFLNSINVKSIEVNADTSNINMESLGVLNITIYVAKEKQSHTETAKMFIESIIEKYKNDTNQDVVFNISAKVLADTKMEKVKHYYARAKYLPKISPTVEIEDKDYLVNIETTEPKNTN